MQHKNKKLPIQTRIWTRAFIIALLITAVPSVATSAELPARHRSSSTSGASYNNRS